MHPEQEKRYNQGRIAHAEQISRQKQASEANMKIRGTTDTIIFRHVQTFDIFHESQPLASWVTPCFSKGMGGQSGRTVVNFTQRPPPVQPLLRRFCEKQGYLQCFVWFRCLVPIMLGLWHCILDKVAYVGLLCPAVGHFGPVLEPSWAVVGGNCVISHYSIWKAITV